MMQLCSSFIGISASLPTTSYIKMIDIWMIFTMTFPLAEVSLLTYKETLNMRLRKIDAASRSQSQSQATIKINPVESNYHGQIRKPNAKR